jgi:indole-3-glycerol phosphate synthase
MIYFLGKTVHPFNAKRIFIVDEYQILEAKAYGAGFNFVNSSGTNKRRDKNLYQNSPKD